MSKSYTAPSKWDMRVWGAKRKVKRMNYEVWQFTENVCRKILFVPKNKDWDIFGEKDERGYVAIDSDKLTASIEHSHIRYHGKPRREHYMDQTLRFIFLNWYQPIFTFKRWVRNKFEWYLFFKAREIHYKTHHYISKTKNDHIDGYFEYKVWGFNCGRTFDLTSLSCLKYDAKEWDTKTKKHKKVLGYIDLNGYGSWGFPTLLVLKEKFHHKDIDKLIHKWYSDRVEYKYRHWTWKGERPKIIIDDLHFMDDLCQSCHYDPTSDTQPHADWCETVKDKNEAV